MTYPKQIGQKIAVKTDLNQNSYKDVDGSKFKDYFFVEDFGIVWKNVAVFALGHVLNFYAIYWSLTHFSAALNFWSKSNDLI